MNRAKQAELDAKLKKLKIEYEKLHKLWLKRINVINSMNDEITSIDSYLGSITLKVTSLFESNDSIDDYVALLKKDNAKLSKKELLFKKNLLQKQAAQLEIEANDFATRMQQLKIDITANHKEQQSQVQQQINKLFNLDPMSYLSGLIAYEQKLLSDEELFSLADDILIIGDELERHASPTQLLNYSQTLMIAQDRALKIFATNANATNASLYSKYSAGFKNILRMLLYQNFNGIADLKYLLELGKEQKVKEYLDEANVLYQKGDLIGCDALMQKISLQAAEAGFERSLSILSSVKNFVTLPLAQQKELIKQHQDLERLRFNLKNIKNTDSSLDLTQLTELSNILEENIAKCIERDEQDALVDREFEEIRYLIEQRQAELYSAILTKGLSDNYKSVGLTAGILSAVVAMTPISPILAVTTIGATAAEGYIAHQNTPTMQRLDVLKDLSKKLSKEQFKEIVSEDKFFGVKNGIEENFDVSNDLSEIKSVSDIITDKAVEHLKPLVEPEVKKVQNKISNFFRTVLGTTASGTSFALTIWGISAIAMFAAVGSLPPFWPVYAVMASTFVVGLILRTIYGDDVDNVVNAGFKSLTGIDFKDSKTKKIISNTLEFIFNLVVKDPILAFSKILNKDHKFAVFSSVVLASSLIIAGAVAMPIIAPSLGLMSALTVGITSGLMAGLHISNLVMSSYHRFKIAKIQLVHEDFSVQQKTLDKIDDAFKYVVNDLLRHFKDRAKALYDEIDILRSQSEFDVEKESAIINKIDKLTHDWKIIHDSIGSPKLVDNIEKYLKEQYTDERSELIGKTKYKEAFSNKGMVKMHFSNNLDMSGIRELHVIKEKLDYAKKIVDLGLD